MRDSKTNAVYVDKQQKKRVLCLECKARISLGQIVRFVEWSEEKCEVCKRPFSVNV